MHDDNEHLRNDALQSSQVDTGLGQDARAFGVGGQTDQNIGGQQHQQHEVNRDASLGAAGESARTDDRRGQQHER